MALCYYSYYLWLIINNLFGYIFLAIQKYYAKGKLTLLILFSTPQLSINVRYDGNEHSMIDANIKLYIHPNVEIHAH